MKICDECETVAHCTKHGCVPKRSTKDAAIKLALEGAANYIDALGGDSRKYRQALAEQPAQQKPEMPYTVMGGELDCSHAEELCKKLTETKGCWHTVIGTGQLKQDGSPAAWSCVVCGTSFAPKMSEKSLADLYQIGFINGRKSAEILSPKKHPQPAQQQEPVLCCGKYETCTQACTPRGRFLGKREALAEQPAQRQEPVAMDAVYAAWHGAGVDIAGGNWSRFVGMLPALYTSPPAQRTWVSLTDEEVDDLSREMVKGKKSVNWLSYSIEAKLKEKNNG